ncbi:ADP-ribosylglycohydrolase family protein [Pseudonocardiaceae bacterium YIM PH 21723]|nr:ADP-ribosylglycohydrolase family protein [Pseudonocardiaceae bacterium YIM PH 21723]
MTTDTTAIADRMLGCVLGGAVGDALGADIEFLSIDAIRQRYGPDGLTDLDSADVALITDDTQMTLFTLDGLIRAHMARRYGHDVEVIDELQAAYQRWLHTQGREWSEAAGPLLAEFPQPPGWLVTAPELSAARAPMRTVWQALERFAKGEPRGSVTEPVNNSKGCGGMVRVAPIALWSEDPREVFTLAVDAAALTHGHPSGYLPAGAFAMIVHGLMRARGLKSAVDDALTELAGWDGHEETTEALRAGIELAGNPERSPELIMEKLGTGSTGESNLAIAVYAAMATTDVRAGYLLCVNTSGDSDSIASVYGNLVGALYGRDGLPAAWLDKIELRSEMSRLTNDAINEFGPMPWTPPHRYGVPEPEPEAAVDEETAPEEPEVITEDGALREGEVLAFRGGQRAAARIEYEISFSGACSVRAYGPWGVVTGEIGVVMHAFQALRKELDPSGWRLAVNGARGDVYCTNKQIEWTHGTRLHVMDSEQDGKPENVFIFDPAEPGSIVSAAVQEARILEYSRR